MADEQARKFVCSANNVIFLQLIAAKEAAAAAASISLTCQTNNALLSNGSDDDGPGRHIFRGVVSLNLIFHTPGGNKVMYLFFNKTPKKMLVWRP